ncbi:winged helix-turn-helix domain-containing protein [Pseudomonas entomophila]|uniref:ATP-binding protein n=1 Tax=Pseudomonas entomophila TaxID=312306 RepID=UPI0023D804E2|nr:winged helix-turn-helix domain-containing protein [Pseudomonas entomophila]MDF0733088.1 winged helix-turn-helix domain-containing protein [Pseudomonas entomophila]
MRLNRTQPGKIVTLDALDTPDPENALCFGPFVLYPQQQLLFKHGEPVHLGSRALQLLVTLASRSGELLEKNELLALVWPKVVVEECNLRAQMTTLRRVLGDEGDFTHIVTVPGRGYRFVAPVSVREASVQAIAPAKVETCLPCPATSVLGREQALRTLAEELRERRLVTLTGSPGIGKTSLALALANTLATHFPQGRTFVDLGSDSAPVAQQVATALGLAPGNDALPTLAEALGNAPHLLMLDNCCHALEDTARVVEALLRQAPGCHVLVTSREPLHAEGEFIRAVAPLPVGANDHLLSATDAQASPAVQLLVQRAAMLDSDFTFSDADVPAAVAICRKLDGNPLAIEIAACHVRAFGLAYLVELLDGGFRLQMTGRRTAQPRHRTLDAALDVSHALLCAKEQTMLRQLSIFSGAFTLAAAKAVVDVCPGQYQDSAWLLESLLDKSLLEASTGAQVKRYRLPHTVRLYAAHKLDQHQETRATAQRHAAYTLSEQHRATQDLERMGTDAWLALHGPAIDCVRSALSWCFGDQGDPTLGVDLVLASVPLWLRLSLIDECHRWVDSGLHFAAVSTRQRMLLNTIAASVMALTHGAGPAIRQAWQQVIDDAQALGDSEHELRGLWGLWHDHCCCNQHPQALALADRYVHLSERTNRLERRLLGRRMRATPLFHMAKLEGARQAISEALSFPLMPPAHVIDSHFDQGIAARSLKAQIQLLQGQVGQALLTLEANVDAAMALHHPASLWYSLSLSAIPITLLVGHEKRSREFLTRLKDSLGEQDLPVWRLFVRCFEHILLIRQGAAAEGVRGLGEALDQLHAIGDSPLYSLVRSEYAQGLAMLGLDQLAVEIIEQTLAITEAREEHWFRPELLRIKAQLLIRPDKPAQRDQAMALLNLAMNEANAQGARFWAGRIAANLSQLANEPVPELLKRSSQPWDQRRQERLINNTQASHT